MTHSRGYQILYFVIHFINFFAKTTWSSTEAKPNILFILVDDLGWNDIGFHGSCDFSTPNIDNLAINYGLQLNNYYVNSLCTPTRAALLSGRYSIRTGMQHGVLGPNEPYGLPLQFTLLSQDLQAATYDTYLFGKWHLGYFNEQYTPTFRGFNTFYGYYNGMEDFFNHTMTIENYNGNTYTRYDLMDNTEPVRDSMLNTYSTYIYGNKTLEVLRRYNDNKNTTKQPFFIYLSLQNVHSPLQAPQSVIDSITINDTNRRIKGAQATVIDTMIGEITQLLNDTGLWDNLLLIFSTDNGAPSEDGGSNYPLRGTKGTLWEGAVRGSAFISGGYLNASRYGQVTNELLHVTDFYLTICDIVGITATNGTDLDGFSFKNILQNEDAYSQREEVLLNIDPVQCNNSWNVCGGIRFGDWKLLVGNIGNQVTKLKTPIGDDICSATWCTNTDINYYETATLLSTTTVKCTVNNATKRWNLTNIYNECPFNGDVCLFNIANDPCEFYDVKENNSDVVEDGLERLKFWNTQTVTPLNMLNAEVDPIEMPSNDYWIPWKNTSEIVMWHSNSLTPTLEPTLEPTLNPTTLPISVVHTTNNPTKNPTIFPSTHPTSSPSQHPTVSPILYTTKTLTTNPTAYPSHSPIILTTIQAADPTNNPTKAPSKMPTSSPVTQSPTHSPITTISPTTAPTLTPTFSPTNNPTTKRVVTEVPSKTSSNKYMTAFYLVSVFSILGCGCIICAGICYKRSKSKHTVRHRRLQDALRGIELRAVVRPPRGGGEYSGLLN